jgi:hypothetical protein
MYLTSAACAGAAASAIVATMANPAINTAESALLSVVMRSVPFFLCWQIGPFPSMGDIWGRKLSDTGWFAMV